MKIGIFTLKREFIVRFAHPESKIWFVDEAYTDKERLAARIEWLKSIKAETKTSKRYIIEIEF